MYLLPKRKRLGYLVGVLLKLIREPRASPVALHGYLGVLQWTGLLNRPFLSCLGRSYEFVERLPADLPQPVLVPAMALGCCLCIDLTRPWADFLLATDAAPIFGFGMAKSKCHPMHVRSIADFCSVEGHGFIPDCVDLASPSVRAVEAPCPWPVHYDHFVPLISAKAKAKSDAPTMEATAVTLAVRRLTRSSRMHGLRTVLLVDAKALMFALRKGRSSSGAFKVQLQRTGALALCADLKVIFGYVPTACNPADPPSRGVVHTLPWKQASQRRVSPWDPEMARIRRALRRLRSTTPCGLPSRLREKQGYDSDSSGSRTAQP